MKTFVVCVVILVSMAANGQSISLRAGHNLTPASHFSLRYEHWTNGAINLSLGGFMEKGRKNYLNYSAYGAELLAETASNREGYSAAVFGWRGGIGVGWQADNEPWIYKDWPLKKRSSFGLLGELSGEWFMTESFALRAFLQQKYLLNQAIGSYRFLLGLGLAYRLSSY